MRAQSQQLESVQPRLKIHEDSLRLLEDQYSDLAEMRGEKKDSGFWGERACKLVKVEHSANACNIEVSRSRNSHPCISLLDGEWRSLSERSLGQSFYPLPQTHFK